MPDPTPLPRRGPEYPEPTPLPKAPTRRGAEKRPKLTLDEAMAILERQEADARMAQEGEKAKIKEKEKVKDLILEGMRQGRGGLNRNSYYDQIED